MKIAVMGTGNVGQTIGAKLIALGHEVRMGSRSAQHEKALAFIEKQGSAASCGTFADAAKFGSVIFNCTAGMGSLAAFASCEAGDLAGKTIIDLANTLDFSKGMPPTLSIVNNSSLGEELQLAFPQANIVKALNTMWCGLMIEPNLVNGGEHDVFICGNDNSAKQITREMLRSFGWKDEHIFDLGDISKARGTEMFLPLWLSLYGIRGNAAFNIRIVQ